MLEQLALVEFAKACGFTLPETRMLLNAFSDKVPLASRLREVGERKIAELDAEAEGIALRKERTRHALRCRCADPDECGRRILARKSFKNR